MATPEPRDREFFQSQWGRLEQIVERFEEAWQRGERPVIDEYLGVEDPRIHPRKAGKESFLHGKCFLNRTRNIIVNPPQWPKVSVPRTILSSTAG